MKIDYSRYMMRSFREARMWSTFSPTRLCQTSLSSCHRIEVVFHRTITWRTTSRIARLSLRPRARSMMDSQIRIRSSGKSKVFPKFVRQEKAVEAISIVKASKSRKLRQTVLYSISARTRIVRWRHHARLSNTVRKA